MLPKYATISIGKFVAHST